MSTQKQLTPEVLDYVADMLRQLRLLAKDHNQEMLAYLIDMAQMEAAEQLTTRRGSPGIGRKQGHGAA